MLLVAFGIHGHPPHVATLGNWGTLANALGVLTTNDRACSLWCILLGNRSFWHGAVHCLCWLGSCGHRQRFVGRVVNCLGNGRSPWLCRPARCRFAARSLLRCRGPVPIVCRGSLAPLRKFEDMLASNREGTNKEDTRQPDENSNKDGDVGQQLRAAQNLVAK